MPQVLAVLGLGGTVLLLLVLLRLVRSPRGGAAVGRFPRLERLLLWGAGLSFLALATSGFWARLSGRPLAGYSLLLHVGCGGVLAAAFSAALLFLGPRFSFGNGTTSGFAYCTGHRVGFWLFALALVGTIATPLLAMLPLLGTDGQEMLLTLHRGCGLAALAFALSLTHAESRLRRAAA